MSMRCKECGGTEFDYDHIRGEYICQIDGFVVDDKIDREDISGFFNSEGQLERKIGGNKLGSDHEKTFSSTRDASGKAVVYNRRELGRMKNFNRNIMIQRNPLRKQVEKYFETMSGNGLIKSIAKKILSHTHSLESHNEKMNNSILWSAMMEANGGNHVPLPLNQTRQAQKIHEKDTRNGNYTVRMVALASMNIASRIVNVELNTKHIAKEHDIQHNHMINESKNIVNYLRIVWVAIQSIDKKQFPGINKIIRFGPGHLFNRSWSSKDIDCAMDLIRPIFEKEVGEKTTRNLMKGIQQMLSQASKHRYLSGENTNLVTSAFAFRISKQVNPKSRLKSKICNTLGIKTNRFDRLEVQYSNVLNQIFKSCWSKGGI